MPLCRCASARPPAICCLGTAWHRMREHTRSPCVPRRLPPNFVERTLRFYESVAPNPYAVLAYLEAHYDPPMHDVSRERMLDNMSMTMFREPLRHAPSQLGWKWSKYVHRPRSPS